MKTRDRGADALVRELAAAGTRRVFTLSGNHVMPVFDAVVDSPIELIHTRHEAAAVHAADAYARLTGEVGIALVTGGPGHANAVSALYTALMSESPVVLLSGHAPHGELGMGAFQEMAQADIAAPITKASWTCKSADDVEADVRRAIEIARSGRPGPVHVSLPSDCLENPAHPRKDEKPKSEPRSRHGDTRSIADRLARAKTPLIITGPACMTKAARARMEALEDASGIAVVGMESPRGIADPSLGAFAEVLARADCILLLGKRLDFTLKFGRPPALRPDCEFLQVDAEAFEIDRTRRAVGSRLAAGAVAPPYAAADCLAREVTRTRSAWFDEVHDAIRYRPSAWDTATASRADRLHPVQALRPLQRILDAHPDSVFISDGGEFGQWAQACLHAPNRVINGAAGAIGPALPFALGARVAEPLAPIIAVMGDGTFGFHAAEIDTGVRHGLAFVTLVGNDARWNAEYQIQLREYGAERAKGCELLPARYDQVAAGFGGYGERVAKAGELLPAMQRALEAGLPACLNVMIEGVAAPSIRR